MAVSGDLPKFVYFDLGNVLFSFSNERACRQMAAVAQVSPDAVEDFFFAADRSNRLERGEVSPRQLYDEFCTALDCRPNYEAMLLAGSDMFALNVDIVPVVAQLTAANIRIGILSNTSLPHWEFLTGGQYRILQDYFEVFALSFQIGVMKPERKIYEVAADLAGTVPECIFFTDDRPENVAAARQAGWTASQYESADKLAARLRAWGLSFNY